MILSVIDCKKKVYNVIDFLCTIPTQSGQITSDEKDWLIGV